MSEENQEKSNPELSADNLRAEEMRLAAKEELKTLLKNKLKTEEKPVTPVTSSESFSKEEEQSTKVERQYTEVEKEQMEKGWNPDYKGTNAVSADEYKRVGEIIDSQRQARKEARVKQEEIDELKTSMKYLVEHNKQIEEHTYKKTLQDLYDRKMLKVAEGDVSAVQAIEREQASLRPPTLTTPVTAPASITAPQVDINNDPNVMAFKEKYKDHIQGKDPMDLAIQGYINTKARQFEQEKKDISIKDAVVEIEEGIKVLLKQFKNPNKNNVAITAQSSGTESSGNYSTSRLNFEQRQVFQRIKSVDSSYTLEKFIKQLESTGKLN